MEQKRFSKNDSGFICAHCQKTVEPLGYTSRNHCPFCLWSLPRDIITHFISYHNAGKKSRRILGKFRELCGVGGVLAEVLKNQQNFPYRALQTSFFVL